jgi:hypothetical protein
MTPTSPLWVGIAETARPAVVGEGADDGLDVGVVEGDADAAAEGLLTGLLAGGETLAVGLVLLVQAAEKRARPATTATTADRPLIFSRAECSGAGTKFKKIFRDFAGNRD